MYCCIMKRRFINGRNEQQNVLERRIDNFKVSTFAWLQHKNILFYVFMKLGYKSKQCKMNT